LIALLAITSCVSHDETPTLDPVVVAEASVRDGALKAVVLKRGGQYRFGIRSSNGTLSIVDQDFVPGGYHEPVVTLRWHEDGVKVAVTVDHDFGDGVLTFIYDTRDFSWTPQQ
jgi:hypothetical protein